MLQFALTTVRSGGAADGRLLPVVIVFIEFGLDEGGERGWSGRGGERVGMVLSQIATHTHNHCYGFTHDPPYRLSADHLKPGKA